MFPFHSSSTFSISGATNSGKTTWVFNLLKNSQVMFLDPPTKILYCYGIWQDLFDQMLEQIPNIFFHEGVPTLAEINAFSNDQNHEVVVLDDIMTDVVKSPIIENLFTRGAHHKKLSIIYLNQNMFAQGKSSRSIALNCNILVLHQNLRDCSQIQRLGQQLFPGEGQMLVEAYKDCLKDPFGYLVIDLSPRIQDHFRLRTKIFPGEVTIIYYKHE